jgi:hypothetical protein
MSIGVQSGKALNRAQQNVCPAFQCSGGSTFFGALPALEAGRARYRASDRLDMKSPNSDGGQRIGGHAMVNPCACANKWVSGALLHSCPQVSGLTAGLAPVPPNNAPELTRCLLSGLIVAEEPAMSGQEPCIDELSRPNGYLKHALNPARKIR